MTGLLCIAITVAYIALAFTRPLAAVALAFVTSACLGFRELGLGCVPGVLFAMWTGLCSTLAPLVIADARGNGQTTGA